MRRCRLWACLWLPAHLYDWKKVPSSQSRRVANMKLLRNDRVYKCLQSCLPRLPFLSIEPPPSLSSFLKAVAVFVFSEGTGFRGEQEHSSLWGFSPWKDTRAKVWRCWSSGRISAQRRHGQSNTVVTEASRHCQGVLSREELLHSSWAKRMHWLNLQCSCGFWICPVMLWKSKPKQ